MQVVNIHKEQNKRKCMSTSFYYLMFILNLNEQ